MQELKNMYDDYPNLKIVFLGASLLKILDARAGLSRRAIVYTMQGLFYRNIISVFFTIAFLGETSFTGGGCADTYEYHIVHI